MTTPTPQYTYRARFVRPIDGDTCVLILDLGCHVAVTRAIRLLGVNTPEVIGASAVAGKAAQAWTAAWLAVAAGGDWPLVVTTTLDRDDKYGRLLGRVWRTSDGACLNDDLLAAGIAVAWDGKGPRPGG